jgi:hypothetical protein
MRQYKVYMSLELVMGRLNKYKLYEFNSVSPVIYIMADDPDDACFKISTKLIDVILKQRKKNRTTLKFIKEILSDVRIKRIEKTKKL